MRKRILLGCAALAILGAIGAMWAFDPFTTKHRITKEGYAELCLGMTLAEVEAILGVPPGDYGPGKGEIVDFGGWTMNTHIMRSYPHKQTWMADSFGITVYFDENSRLNGCESRTIYRPYDSRFEMLLQSLRLQQKKAYPRGSVNEWNEIVKMLSEGN